MSLNTRTPRIHVRFGLLPLLAGLLVSQPSTAVKQNAELRVTGVSPFCAAAGEELTISGGGFGERNVRVEVDGEPAELRKTTGHTATLVIPPEASSGLAIVKATNPGGISGSIDFVIQGAETCDGLDNDCNGLVDEGLGCEEVLPRQMANLTVLSVTPSPTYPEPGEAVDVEVVVLNVSRRGASPLSEGVEVSFLVNGSPAGTQLTSISSSRSASVSFSWTPESSGEHTLTAHASFVAEGMVDWNRLDDAFATPIVVAPRPPPGADLAVSAIEVVPRPDQPALPLVTVTNLGESSVSAPLLVHANDQPTLLQLVGPIATGDSLVVEVPQPTGVTLSLLGAEINPRFAFLESNQLNNFLQVIVAPPADPAVRDVSVHVRPEEGGTSERLYSVSFRVSNEGTNPTPVALLTRLLVAPGPLRFDVITPVLDPLESQYVSHTFEAGAAIDFSVEVDPFRVSPDDDRSNNRVNTSYGPAFGLEGEWVSIGPVKHDGSAQAGAGRGTGGATGRFEHVAIDPQSPATIYAGAPGGTKSAPDPGGSGLWKTLDGGATWFPIGDSLPSLAIDGLALDPAAPSTVYALTRNTGLFRSDDGGTSWLQIHADPLGGELATAHNGPGFLIDPTDGSRMFLTARDGVHRSVDGGLMWQRVLWAGPSHKSREVGALVMHPSDPQRLVAAITNPAAPSKTGIHETVNGGAPGMWSGPVQGCPNDALPDNPGPGADVNLIRLAFSQGRFYAGYRSSGSACYTIYRTSGDTCFSGGPTVVGASVWEKGWNISDPGTCSGMWSYLQADPTNRDQLYLTGVHFWGSQDGGSSFKQVLEPMPHVDHHGFAFDPVDSRILYTASDGGLYRSSDRGKAGTWKFIGEGVTSIEFFDIAQAATNPSLVIGGTQDNGTLRYDGSPVWTPIWDGDGATVDIDPTDPSILYAMHQQEDEMGRTEDGGASGKWSSIGLPVPDGECANLRYQLDPRRPSHMLAPCSRTAAPTGGLWLGAVGPPANWSVDLATGSQLPPGKFVANIDRTAVDPVFHILFAGSSRGQLYARQADVFSWQEVFDTKKAMPATDIEVDPNDPNIIYASFGGTAFGAGRVFRLERLPGVPTLAETDLSPGLPVMDSQGNLVRVRALAVDPVNDLTIYAATNRGVFRGRSLNDGANWLWDRYSFGLPKAVDVQDLEMHPVFKGRMRAGTINRGAYEVNTVSVVVP